MRVGVDRTKYQIQIPLPPKIDPTVTMMTVEEKPDVYPSFPFKEAFFSVLKNEDFDKQFI